MNLSAPQHLLALLLIPALAAVALRAAWKKRASWLALGRDDPPKNRAWLVSIAAAACLVVALARPVGEIARSPQNVRGRDIVLAIDVSRSMGADDANPSRLHIAQSIARGALQAVANPFDRVALVAFAGRAVVRSPLTENLGAVRDAIDALQPGRVQPGGTNLGAAINLSLRAFDDQQPSDGKSIILISDGEDHAGTWRQTLADCRAQRVIVHTLAVGDAVAGAPLSAGSAAPPITTRRVDAPLRAIAEATGGAFVAVGTASIDAASLFRDVVAPGAQRTRLRLGWTERAELFPWLVAPALLLLCCHDLAKRGFTHRAVWNWLILAAALHVLAGASPDDRGRALFDARDFGQARALYAAARRAHPDDPRLVYNEAEALFALRQYEAAARLYQSIRTTRDLALRPKVLYALANSHTALGDYRPALETYDAALALLPPQTQLRAAVLENRAFALAQLEAQKKPPDASPRANADGAENPAQPPRNDPPMPDPPDSTATSKGADPDTSTAGGADDTDDPRSPAERLRSALQNIQNSKSGRLPPAETPPERPDQPDW